MLNYRGDYSADPNAAMSFFSMLYFSSVSFMIGKRTGPISIPLMMPNIALAISIPAPAVKKRRKIPFKRVQKDLNSFLRNREQKKLTIFSSNIIKFENSFLWKYNIMIIIWFSYGNLIQVLLLIHMYYLSLLYLYKVT